jgi:hypothetical protein
LFDRNVFSEIKLLDEKGEPIQLHGQGQRGAGSQSADQRNGNLGWLTCTLSPGEGTNTPRQVTAQLQYTVGPLERTQQLRVSAQVATSMTLEGSSQLSGYGQTVDGHAFVSIAVDVQGTKGRKFGVVAVTATGQELEPSGGRSVGNDGSGVSTAQFEFDTPISSVKYFRIGTRFIRTMEWKDVVLP